jgi:hypothetical protein
MTPAPAATRQAPTDRAPGPPIAGTVHPHGGPRRPFHRPDRAFGTPTAGPAAYGPARRLRGGTSSGGLR